jgi:signal transduction histidine kinase
MKADYRSMRKYGPALLVLLFPVILISSSIQTFNELRQMRDIYLRNRTAAIAARLETLDSRSAVQALADEEPDVIRILIHDSPNTEKSLDGLWTGRELFRTEMAREGDVQVFRAFVPFHEGGSLRVARIDLDGASADFLLVHARHNVLIAAASGLVMIVLSGYILWAMRRVAAEEKHHLELTHLAHVGKLAAVLAHEIRTPLATIKGFTQLGLERAEEGLRPVLMPVVTEIQRLERLVSDLLLYGRPPQPVAEICSWQAIAESLRESASLARIDSGPIRFRSDAGLLLHVLRNLVRNAEDAVAGNPTGSVDVSAAIRGNSVLISVEDNGPGIPKDSEKKVFDSFYTTKPFGTGLGLPIARTLAEALQGDLKLKPRPGGGVRAEVCLPGVVVDEPAAKVRQ